MRIREISVEELTDLQFASVKRKVFDLGGCQLNEVIHPTLGPLILISNTDAKYALIEV
jgi:hypothetical protein